MTDYLPLALMVALLAAGAFLLQILQARQHLAQQLAWSLILKTQPRSHHLVRHREQNWFRLNPDLLIRESGRDALVLDTKWKLLDGLKANGSDKYGLSQGDFYQLQAYGQS